MPLRCMLDGRAVHAWRISAARWKRLEQTYRGRDLRMPCCGHPAIPRTNARGGRYFVHTRRDGCDAPVESAGLLFARQTLARAAHAAGWEITTEFRGHTPEGDEWFADVLATKAGTRYALQILWTPQHVDEIRREHALRVRSGVRTVWFQRLYRGRIYSGHLHGSVLPDDPELPVFGIAPDRAWGSFRVSRYEVSLQRFTRGLLAGELAWGPTDGTSVRAGVVLTQVACWACGETMGLVLGLELRMRGGQHLDFLPFGTQDATRLLKERELPAEFWARHDVGVLKPRPSEPRDTTYYSNGCVHCDTLFGNWYVGEEARKLKSKTGLPEPVLEWDVTLGTQVSNRYVTWRFREDPGTTYYRTPRSPPHA